MLEDKSRKKWVARVRDHPVNYWAPLVADETLAEYLLGPDPSIKALRAEMSESGMITAIVVLSKRTNSCFVYFTELDTTIGFDKRNMGTVAKKKFEEMERATAAGERTSKCPRLSAVGKTTEVPADRVPAAVGPSKGAQAPSTAQAVGQTSGV